MNRRGGKIDWDDVLARLRRAQESARSPEPGAEERASILEERARVLARPLLPEAPSATATVIVFRLEADRFALPLAEVAEVIRAPRIARAPGAAAEVAGVIQVRGDVRPVYHLRRLLGLNAAVTTNPAFVLMVRQPAGTFGIGADEIEDVRENPGERKIAPAASGYAGWATADLVPVLAGGWLLKREE